MAYFLYGQAEIDHLSRADAALGREIAHIGMVQRRVIPDLFEALVHAIVGQQISTKAQETVFSRIQNSLGLITPQAVLQLDEQTLSAFGISRRKAGYIRSCASAVQEGALDLHSLCALNDEKVCAELAALPGIGVWTAQMLMLFSMQRPNILCYEDLAIRRGLCLLHGLETLPRSAFEDYRDMYSPYGSAASLYLWEIAHGR